MKEDLQRKIEEADRQWRTELTIELAELAYEAYFWGDYGAWSEANLKVDESSFNRISADSQAYAETYSNLLKEQGGSMIGGEVNPWLAQYTEEQRTKISEIITNGLNEGHQTGIKEKIGGGYPEGSIAKDLEPFFGERTSHASMVARTEVARIQIHGKLNRYEKSGYNKVKVLDGSAEGGSIDGCDECRALNGEIWDIEYARSHELEHPQCVRTFVPVDPNKTEE